MEAEARREHWENIYQTKQLCEVSWYEPTPATSLKLIEESQIKKDAKIIDVGGGDSLLADYLLEKGYSDITVLDISASALERAKQRLGEKSEKIKWVNADASEFIPTEKYDLWHDRAAFHFFTDEKEINKYITTVRESLNPNGISIIGTFSEKGPKKCSGIEVRQYSEEELATKFKDGFIKLTSFTTSHTTPFKTQQDFLFCRFQKAA